MKRFSFKLEKVLKLREFREEQTRIELGQAVGVLSGIENDIKHTAQAKNSAAMQRFSSVNAGMNTYSPASGRLDMLAWDHYIARLNVETEQLLKKAAEAELVVEEKREIYLSASRDLKVLEKLKEKRKKEYRREYFVAETRELDDLKRVSPFDQSGEELRCVIGD